MTRILTHGNQVTDARRMKVQYVRYDTPRFLEFGLLRDSQLGYYLPTGITFMYLWSGGEAESRSEVLQFLDEQHPFFKNRILELPAKRSHRVWGAQSLLLSEQYLQKFAIDYS